MTLLKVNSKLLDKRITILRGKVNGWLEAFKSICIFMQLSINSTALTPKLSWFRDLIDFLSPDLQHCQRTFFCSKSMNPLCNEPTCMWPFFRCSIKNFIVLSNSIVKEILPIRKFKIFYEVDIVNKEVSICLKDNMIVGGFYRRAYTFPFYNTEVNLF